MSAVLSEYLSFVSDQATYFVIGAGVVLAVTILVEIFIMPESRREELGSFGLWLNNIFNIRQLWTYEILKFFYVLSTFAVIILGILYAVLNVKEPAQIILLCLGFTVLGPIAVRLCYEFVLMLFLLTDNVMDINKRLREMNEERSHRRREASASEARDRRDNRESYRQNSPETEKKTIICPECGKRVPEGSMYCTRCGSSLAPKTSANTSKGKTSASAADMSRAGSAAETRNSASESGTTASAAPSGKASGAQTMEEMSAAIADFLEKEKKSENK